jgi:uncharacterized protein YndB with AHSA1/START domain
MNEITERSQIHATFVIEREFDAPLQRVWHALSESDARDRWFGGGSEFDTHAKSHGLVQSPADSTPGTRSPRARVPGCPVPTVHEGGPRSREA